MKTAEKFLKQTLLLNQESKLQEFCVEHLANKNEKDLKRISKNQYKLLNKNLALDTISIKFPCYLAYESSKKTIIAINKHLKLATPKVFLLKNENFSFDIKKNCLKLYNLQKPTLLLCKIIFLILHKSCDNIQTV